MPRSRGCRCFGRAVQEWRNISHVLNWRRNSRTTTKNSKNALTTRQKIFTIWRISAELIIPLSPELAEKQANEEENLTSIEVSMFYLVFKPEINNKWNSYWIRLSYDLKNQIILSLIQQVLKIEIFVTLPTSILTYFLLCPTYLPPWQRSNS